MFLVNDGLFEHFLINKVHENVEIRGIENIQIPFRTHGNVLFRTCYRMYSYVKFNPFSFFYQKILVSTKRGLVVSFLGVIARSSHDSAETGPPKILENLVDSINMNI